MAFGGLVAGSSALVRAAAAALESVAAGRRSRAGFSSRAPGKRGVPSGNPRLLTQTAKHLSQKRRPPLSRWQLLRRLPDAWHGEPRVEEYPGSNSYA